jgi:hypothetical protein
MTELRVHNFSISLDGFAAGAARSEEHPLGRGGTLLHEWVFSPGATDTDRGMLARGEDGVGARIMA